jgi:AraC-like DNA-binding protein
MSVLVVSCVLGLSHLFVLLFWLCRQGLKSLPEKLFFLFLLSASAYLVGASGDFPVWVERLITALYTGAAGFFWLLCSALFNDNYRLKTWHLVLVVATMLLPLVNTALDAEASLYRLILVAVPQLLEYAMILIGLAITLLYWRGDLVEERRIIRAGTLGLVGVYLLGAVGSKHFFAHNLWWDESGSYVIAAAIAVVFSLYLGGLRPNVLFVPRKVAVPTILIDENNKLAGRLRETMQAGIYRETGLTIGNLAKQIDMQEHNLRRLINKKLGYRNFNDFLNSYRIEEAASRLKGEDLPILTIALDSGFGSLTSFNSAFKQTFGVPPSQFRKEAVTQENHA